MSSVPTLVLQVRTGFILQGSSFASWCRSNQIDRGYAHKCVAGRNNGPGAVELRKRIIKAANVESGE